MHLFLVSRKEIVLIEDSKMLKVGDWKKKCAEHGGLLASINNEAEQNAVEQILKSKKLGTHAALIAAHRNPKKPKQFLNGQGEPQTYT